MIYGSCFSLTFSTIEKYHSSLMNNKHRKTLALIFSENPGNNICWADVESLFRALDAVVMEGAGSRVHVALNEKYATFHRPHSGPTIRRGVVKAVRNFLEDAEVAP